ncbi:MAG: AAA family ATPase [Candidatus Thermoplasmatota archaeon]|jgi:Cdc6-like AAA superfamily ATPase|nr:AAA family ATPase [Candidatus Thermoplasmatota archaeon]
MKIIKNSAALSQDYVPEIVLGREEQINQLKELIRVSDVSSTFVIRGNPGTGKTLTGKYLLKDLKEFNGVYVNCYVNQTDRSIVSSILDNPNIRLPEIGNTRSESLSNLLFKELPSKKNLIVLDESQSLKRSHGQIVYLLSRSKELGGPDIKLVLLSMEEPEMYLDRSTLSGLGRYNRITLKEYSISELFNILKSRASISLYEGAYTDSAIGKISELTEENGSARIAIELLRNSALFAESRGTFLDDETVLNAYREFSPPLDESSLINLEEDEIHLLRSLLELTDIENGFKASDLKNLRPDLSDSRMYKFLKTIELSGLVKKSRVGKGYSGGVENEYLLRVSPRVLISKLSLIEKSIGMSQKED